MTNHPTTPPTAQISTVIAPMGMGAEKEPERTRFVRKRSTTPTIALMTSPDKEPSRPSAIKTTSTINMMSTIGSMKHHYTRDTASLVKAHNPRTRKAPCCASGPQSKTGSAALDGRSGPQTVPLPGRKIEGLIAFGELRDRFETR